MATDLAGPGRELGCEKGNWAGEKGGKTLNGYSVAKGRGI
jgi:hypothetical protein